MFSMLAPTNDFYIGKFHGTFYGLFVALGMVGGLLITCFLAKKKKLSSDNIFVLSLYVFPLAILGARIYYCTFSGRAYSFVEFIRITDGGLAVYGSIIGGAIGGLVYSMIHKKSFIKILDVVVVGLALGQAIGRIGCYFGGCCYGEIVTSTSMQFFPLSVFVDGNWHFATFFYESIWNLIGFVVLLILFNKLKVKGSLTASYLVWYGIGRCIIEGIRGDSLLIGNTHIRVSQLLSAIIAVIGIVILSINLYKRKNSNDEKV